MNKPPKRFAEEDSKRVKKTFIIIFHDPHSARPYPEFLIRARFF